ncbi:MAG TPA: DUF1330 domain-containing protein [Frankiaceae bacterium]|nr:DUF1330 domain-containing protein [Frankiaceae bacterium]
MAKSDASLCFSRTPASLPTKLSGRDADVPNAQSSSLGRLRRIDATLEPFSGRFLVHGAAPQLMDGELPGVVVVIGFPDLDSAAAAPQ